MSLLYWACCKDYWSELVQRTTPVVETSGDAAVPGHVSAPVWGDMLAVLTGYLRLYRGRRFINLKVRA